MNELKAKIKYLFGSLRKISLTFWILILVAFILGFLIRGGCSSISTEELHSHSPEQTVKWWTCSMHPQIKLPQPGQCPICFMDLIPLETDIDATDEPAQLKLSENALKLAEIQTTQIERQVATAEIHLSGRVEYDETRQKTITAWIPGRLERLFVDYTGTPVNKGEHLVSLYSPELYTAQQELIQARRLRDAVSTDNSISAKSAQMNLRAAREKLRLLGLTTTQVEKIEQQKIPEHTVTIYSPLTGIVTEKHTNQGEYVQIGTKIYTVTDLSQLWVILDAYESDLFWLRYAQTVAFEVEAYPGEIFTGMISFIDPVLNPKTRTVSIRVNLPNREGKLKPGMFVRGTVHARLDADGNSINPQLAGKWISPMHPEIVKNKPGTCDICGMPLVRAEELGIVRKPSHDQLPLLVPASAVLKTGQRALVYIKIPGTDEPTFEAREIRIGARAGDYYLVQDGVKEGEEVVTNGNFKIDAAMQIAAKKSMMNPEGGISSAGHQHHPATPQNIPPKKETPDRNQDHSHIDATADFRSALAPLYHTYLNIQQALADDRFDTARDEALRLQAIAAKTDQLADQLLAKGTRSDWRRQHRVLQEATEHAHHWNNIAQIRQSFESLSEMMIELAEHFGNSGADTLYQAYCPMAFDNRGARWLQTGRTIDNPYFGAQMRHCGEIQSDYRPLNSEKESDHGD